MEISRFLARTGKGIYKLSKATNIVGVSVLAMMMLFTVTDVCLRYFFNRPLAGSFELTEFMMAIVISFGLAHTAALDGHISVDLLTSRLPQRVRLIFSCITNLISATVFALVTWQNFVQAKTLYLSGLESEVLYFPVFPFVIATGFGFALIFFVFLIKFFDSLSRVIKEWNQLP